MVAGILLGPSVLGHFAPAFAAEIFPQSIVQLLNIISQFGVILYMFLALNSIFLPCACKEDLC